MNYELAQQLKDAGFRQRGFEPCEICNDEKLDCPIAKRNKEGVHIPTLSELIEACLALIPDKFLDIGCRGYKGIEWYATSLWKHETGATPEEAVARLWLALNEK